MGQSTDGRPTPLTALRVTAVIVCIALPAWASAQRAADNAITEAQDAFGTQVDQQSIGLYSPGDARGFNPQLAGNLRLDGLYIAQVDPFINSCLIRETTMHVGFGADPFIFPAPTGVVDMTLRTPGQKKIVSALATSGDIEGETATLEAQLPAAHGTLAVDLCAAYFHNNDYDYSTRAHGLARSAVGRWKPSDSVEVTPFMAVADGGEQNLYPLVYTDSNSRPPEFGFHDLSTSDRTNYGWRHINTGLVARAVHADQWALTGGIFRSDERDPSNSSPLYFLGPNAKVAVVLDQAPGLHSQAWSGEIRAVRQFHGSVFSHRVALSIRARSTHVQFGGDRVLDLGPASLFAAVPIPNPVNAFDPVSHDRVRQEDWGVAYEIKRPGRAALTLGLLRDNYHRTVEQVNLASPATLKSRWLVTARTTIDLSSSMLLYASEVQGVEDSPLAPASAVNKGELLAASGTRQTDLGVRLMPAKSWQWLVGAFEIRKPYYNLNESGLYGAIGELTHRGIESSASYANQGITVVAGAVLLQPRDARTTERGTVSEVPLGPVPTTLNVNVDAAPERWHGWGASVQWKWLSARNVTSGGTSRLPPLNTLNVGARYYSGNTSFPWSIRLDIYNVGDSRGLHVSNVAQLQPEQPRRAVVTFAVDYW
ncbi:MAG: hypothetical protein JSR66_19930 [Proteobacteria bacterium]|nr:hypothetical protein [Pseudomonadota bacterium]